MTQDLLSKTRWIYCGDDCFGMALINPMSAWWCIILSKTLEGYYQEIGRAGRDGLDSDCVMFYTYADTRKHQFLSSNRG